MVNMEFNIGSSSRYYKDSDFSFVEDKNNTEEIKEKMKVVNNILSPEGSRIQKASSKVARRLKLDLGQLDKKPSGEYIIIVNSKRKGLESSNNINNNLDDIEGMLLDCKSNLEVEFKESKEYALFLERVIIQKGELEESLQEAVIKAPGSMRSKFSEQLKKCELLSNKLAEIKVLNQDHIQNNDISLKVLDRIIEQYIVKLLDGQSSTSGNEKVDFASAMEDEIICKGGAILSEMALVIDGFQEIQYFLEQNPWRTRFAEMQERFFNQNMRSIDKR